MIRIVEGRSSKVAMQLELKLRFDYGMSVHGSQDSRIIPVSAPFLGRTRWYCVRREGIGVLLLLAPLASFSLAGQKHGRIIPSVDMKWVES